MDMQAEATVLKGPKENFKTYLMAMDELRSNLYFFSSMKTFRNRDRVVNHINNLLVEAVLKLEEEFKRLLSAYRFVPTHSYSLTFHTLFFFLVQNLIFS